MFLCVWPNDQKTYKKALKESSPFGSDWEPYDCFVKAFKVSSNKVITEKIFKIYFGLHIL